MNKMTLILHIGTEKTGTTLIQKWLYANRSRLSAQGVFLSDMLGWENNRRLVAYFRTEPDEFWTFNGLRDSDDKNRYFADFLTALEAEIESASDNHHSMVITSEHFHSRLTDEDDLTRFSAFCRKYFKDHVVVCYLRPQWDVRKSLYSTDLKNNESRAFDDYRNDASDRDRYFNYMDLYRRWKRNFPYAEMEFRSYDRDAFTGGDIRRDFLSTFPSEIDPTELEFSDRRENESLTLLEAAAYMAINRAVPLFENEGVNRRNYDYKKLISGISQLKLGKITDSHSHDIYEVFKKSNGQLFSEVFAGVDIFGYPREEEDATARMSLKDVAILVENLVECLVRYFDRRVLSEQAIDLIRDAALALGGEAAMQRKEMIALLEIAARARPEGPVIKSKLNEWRRSMSSSEVSGELGD
ncbi:MAG: hypothetical protein KDE63_03065 [Novosphingobium sp.]|nr:hypothetical protein [Novosphingobium sp.]